MRKPASTNSWNERGLILGCPMTYTASLLGRRWKPIILWKIHEGFRTSAALGKAIPLISRKMLFQDLRELQSTALIARSPRPGSPHGAEYTLTAEGASLLPVLVAMLRWGEVHRPQPVQGSISKN